MPVLLSLVNVLYAFRERIDLYENVEQLSDDSQIKFKKRAIAVIDK